MILQKIYYYRKSAVEIFTETKSYFFNFFSERDMEKFMDTIKVYLIKETNYFMPIKYKNKKKIGYIKMKDKFVKKNKKTSFIDFISYNEGINKICHFDLIILMNLIGNRSYLDLTQYPVFPVLFFREKGNKQNLERKLDLHKVQLKYVFFKDIFYIINFKYLEINIIFYKRRNYQNMYWFSGFK